MYMRIVAMAGALFLALPAVASAQAAGMAEGARAYSNNCTRCHNVRPPAERTDLQWRIIVNHMRARANLTRTQAESVMVYLQAVNSPAQAMPSEASAEAAPADPAEKGEAGPTEPAEKEEAGGSGGGPGGGEPPGGAR